MASRDLIRVAIVEDDLRTRDGLAFLIDSAQGYRCTGKFTSVEQALRDLEARTTDVILLDIHLPGTPGSEGVRLLRSEFPSLQILMLTIYDEEEKVFESICNGASGYLLKKTPPSRLLEAIAEVRNGGSPISPEVARKVIRWFQRTRSRLGTDARLTPQELRLLTLLAEGHSYQGAASELNLSINTIRNYVRSIYEKLHVHSKSAAVGRALRDRLIY